MKKYIVIFFVFALLLSSNYAQKIETVTAKEYAKYLQKIKDEYVAKGRANEIDLSEAKKMVYLAYRQNPALIQRMFINEEKWLRKKCDMNKQAYLTLFKEKKSIVEKNIFDMLKEKLLPSEYNLLSTDLLLHGKVIKKHVYVHAATDNSRLKIRMVELQIIIEDLIVGNSLVDNGDTLMIRYSPDWQTVAETWKEKANYIFNLKYRTQSKSKNTYLSIITYLGGSGYFPIIDERVIDKTNYFQQGNRVHLSYFKQKIDKIIDNIIR